MVQEREQRPCGYRKPLPARRLGELSGAAAALAPIRRWRCLDPALQTLTTLYVPYKPQHMYLPLRGLGLNPGLVAQPSTT